MTTDEKIEKLLTEFSKRNLISADSIYHILGKTDENESLLLSEHILRQLKESEIIGSKQDYNFYLLPKGVDIVENYGGWIKYKKRQEIKEKRIERKAELDLLLAEWQVKIFWWLFLLAIVGGISGIVSLIMQLSK